MGPKWVKMRVGRGGRKWGPKTEKLKSENTKIGLEITKIGSKKHKKMGPKINKMRVGRVESGGEGRGGEEEKEQKNERN
jgi:hypothetical protein